MRLFHTLRFKRFPVLVLGTKLMFGFFESIYAIFLAAYNFLISIWVDPYFLTDSLISLAASASAYDLIICAVFNYSSLKTMNFCLSANCCCTALLSTALAYYLPNWRFIKLTSATFTLKLWAFSQSNFLIYLLIFYLNFNNWSASSKN